MNFNIPHEFETKEIKRVTDGGDISSASLLSRPGVNKSERERRPTAGVFSLV